MLIPAQRSEVRLASLLVGIIQIAWSVLPITGGDGRFLRILRYFHHTEEWLIYSMLCGTLLIIGSLCPLRKVRHMGQFLSSVVWFTYFGMWLTYWAETGRWVVTPTTMLFPVLGLYCILLMWHDVSQKPKSKGGC